MKDKLLGFIKDYIYIMLGVVCILVVGALFLMSQNRPAGVIEPIASVYANEEVTPQAVEASPATEPEIETIFVHIVGEVVTPQVLELPRGARVNDALIAAGGETEDADLSLINLAAVLQDGMQVVIPAFGDEEVQIFTSSGNVSAMEGGLININTATTAELQTLPGIGPARAQSIIDLRDSLGGFTAIEDLLRVSGIGSAIFEGLRDMVRVG